jgi:uncharacterized protein (DUF2141 family)
MKVCYALSRQLLGLLFLLLPLALRAAPPVLRLEATVAAGASNVTAFVDLVEILDATTGLPVRNAVPNASFETSGALGNTTYSYTPAGATWAFGGNSGIAANGSTLSNPPAPQGSQVAFLQSKSDGTGFCSQPLPALAPGLYRVRLRAAQRNTSPANQGVRVLVDGVVLGTFLPTSTTAFATYYSATFAVARPSSSGVFTGGAALTTDGRTALRVGSAAPAVTDVDGDGLLDLLVGNGDGNVLRFEQTVASGSVFALVGTLTTNGSTLLDVGTFATPAVTDVDGDGLLDLLVGNAGGNVLRYEQTAAAGGLFSGGALLTTDGGTTLDVGDYAAPIVTDMDGNGRLDLLVGNGVGNVQRYEQTAANGGIFGGGALLTINGTTSLDVGDYAAPAVTDVDGNGRLDLLVGNGAGNVRRYEQTVAAGGIVAFVNTLTTDGSTTLNAGTYIIPAVTDVDGDGRLDLLVGNLNGSVQRYEQADLLTALALAPQAVAENEASGTVVGTFTTTTAPGAGQPPFTYTLVAGTGSTHNARFSLGTGATAGQLLTAAVFDYETQASYSIRVRTTDASGLFFEQAFTISITDLPEPPTLTGVAPGSGPVGTTLTLTGANLTGLSSVLVGEIPAAFTVTSPTSATATVPRGATSQRVRITRTMGLASDQGTALSAAAFTVTQPSTSSSFAGGNVLFDPTNNAILDVGAFAALAATDVDGDGLLDLLVGNQSGNVLRYEQTVANGNRFALVSTLTTDGTTPLDAGDYAAPAVTDVDGNGLLDLLVGTSNGTVQRYEQAVAGGDVFALVGPLTTDGTTPLEVRANAGPAVTDVDGDGLLDLLVGNNPGTVQRFEQTAANGDVFALVGTLTTDGTTPLTYSNLTKPAVADLDGDGLLDLLVGNNRVNLQHYEQTVAGGDVFALVGTLTSNGTTAVNAGPFSTPVVTDVDGDGLLDLLVGTNPGTVQRFEQVASAPLPVELTDFTATPNGHAAVRLAWATASEKNSARFEVERSLDGRSFGHVGSVPGAGSSSTPRTYTYLDALTLLPASSPTLLYYRLRQVDQDGTASYSPVRTVRQAGGGALLAYPVPARVGQALVVAGLPGMAPLALHDALGRRVALATAGPDGTATLTLPAGLASGVYVLHSGGQALRVAVE